MQVSLLTIGDELLIGQVLNSNAQWMSQQLTDQNLAVTHHLTVGDRREAILEALAYLAPKSDAIIVGGGLGPTHDDITMEVLAEYFKSSLKYDAEWISRVEAFFRSRGRVMSENNKKQGYLLKDAVRIDNDCGTAAGQHLEVKTGGRALHVFVVPGVPHELKSMATRYILPTLKKISGRDHELILKETLLTTGIGESALAERANAFVQKVQKDPRLTLAFLPSTIGVRLRLQMKTSNPKDEPEFRSLVDELKEISGQDFFGFDPLTMEELVVKTLTERKQSLALAESCTGGFLAHKITQISGASKILRGSLVCYQTELKENDLGIPHELIATKGVVSEPTARAMAEGIRTKWKTDFGIGITGFLGPDGDQFAEPGTVWIAVATPSKTVAREFKFEQNRERGKERAAQSALDLLRRNW